MTKPVLDTSDKSWLAVQNASTNFATKIPITYFVKWNFFERDTLCCPCKRIYVKRFNTGRLKTIIKILGLAASSHPVK